MSTGRALTAALIAIGAAFVPSVAGAQEVDWTATQQCVQFDGTLLPEGTFMLVRPTEFYGPNGHYIPVEATGTLASGHPWPCAPLPTEPPVDAWLPNVSTPVEVAPVAAPDVPAPAAIVQPVAVASPFVAIRNAMLDLQAILVGNGGW